MTTFAIIYIISFLVVLFGLFADKNVKKDWRSNNKNKILIVAAPVVPLWNTLAACGLLYFKILK